MKQGDILAYFQSENAPDKTGDYHIRWPKKLHLKNSP